MSKSIEEQIKEVDFCLICGKGNLPHPQCEPTEEQLDRHAKLEKEMLEEFSVNCAFGVGENNLSRESYIKALSIFKSYYKGEVSFSENEVVEGDSYWYFPQTWIGCIGYIVENDSNQVFCLGSGLVGRYKGTNYYGSWIGIKAYLDGKVEPENS